MLFNSYEFIFIFLPLTFGIYFYLNKKRLIILSKYFLIFSSLTFYSWWNISYLPLILGSISFNYLMGKSFKENNSLFSKYKLVFGISMNLLLLGYFKYADFFIENINLVMNTQLDLLYLVLPLAISFFTFQQIAYLVDSYKKETQEYSFLDYTIFVTFFPQLIAGPIVHHKEMIPQFFNYRNKIINYKNISMGFFIFTIGLFKKVVIADTFSMWATQGFDVAVTLNLFEAWATSLSYTFQLYFDFSGYTDMAIGLALLFNIKLPINFYSPYKALNIQDFWKRWHITLSSFLKDYIYIPLGGNRKGDFRTYGNLLITFILGGLWHGAAWTFVFWGFLHGVALTLHRIWKKLGFSLWTWLGWLITFNFINISWIFFRAERWEDAMKVLGSMFSLDNIILPKALAGHFEFLNQFGVKFGGFAMNIQGGIDTVLWLFLGFILILLFKNSIQKLNGFKPNKLHGIFYIIISLLSFYKLSGYSEFLYFRF